MEYQEGDVITFRIGAWGPYSGTVVCLPSREDSMYTVRLENGESGPIYEREIVSLVARMAKFDTREVWE